MIKAMSEYYNFNNNMCDEFVYFTDVEIINKNTETPKNNDDKNRYPSRKRKTGHQEPPQENKNNKKTRTDDDLINLLIHGKNDNDSSDSDSSDNEKELECNNPYCDHKEFTSEEKSNNRHKNQERPKEIKTIDDLIELGKKYHCKKNTSYYGVNLRILCNLVEPLTKLKNMIGMKNVKENMVNQIVFFLQGFNQKENCNECMDCIYGLPCTSNQNQDMLHTIITGPPGVGKTEVGKILAQVYKAMGVLSKGHMHIATRSDLIGKYLGHTAAKTQEFINKCKGGVMFIDEAYSLGNPEGRDSFSKECLDTLNQNMSEHRDFLVIIAGYAEALDKSFFQYNEGLKRRFTFRYDIKGYTPEELMEIFLYKIKKDNWSTEVDLGDRDSVEVIKQKEEKRIKIKNFFAKNKRYFPFYGGDVESFILNCKTVHSKRVMFLSKNEKKILTVSDIEKGLEVFVSHRKYKNKDSDGSGSMTEIQTIYS